MSNTLSKREQKKLLNDMIKETENVYDLFFPRLRQLDLPVDQQLAINSHVYGLVEGLRETLKKVKETV